MKPLRGARFITTIQESGNDLATTTIGRELIPTSFFPPLVQ